MTSTAESEAAWLRSLSATERASFMALLAHGLTIAARVLCHSSDGYEKSLEQLRQLNEAQHQVTGYLLYCLTGAENLQFIPYVVASVLSLHDSTALQQTEQAWSYAKSHLSTRDA
jgi:hypothetical protein